VPVHVSLGGPLTEARFIDRPNRFLAEAQLADGEIAAAHLADPGRLCELLLPGRRVWLRPVERAGRRKTRWTVVLVESPSGRGLVSLDTTLPNRLIGRALAESAMPELAGWSLVRPEAPVGRHRIDFLLRRPGGEELLLEVKSVTLVAAGEALFPDAVTTRGASHLRLLRDEAARGRSAAVMFVAQRGDASRVRAAREIDPAFADALDEARAAGVMVHARRCRVRLDRVVLGAILPAR
jgi:sugar fermentation stimulation protein A